MNYLVSGSIPITTGVFSSALFCSTEVELTREEMGISEKEYDIQQALGSLPQKTVTGGTFYSLPLVSGSISHNPSWLNVPV